MKTLMVSLTIQFFKYFFESKFKLIPNRIEVPSKFQSPYVIKRKMFHEYIEKKYERN